MAIHKQTLFDLFGDFSALWPVDRIQAIPGHPGPLSTAPTPQVWLAALNKGVGISQVRAGVLDDRVAVEAHLTLDNAKATFSGSPGAFPFVLASMPDVEFRVQTITGQGKFAQLFVSVSDAGAEVLLEGLPVEILLPRGLLGMHPSVSEQKPAPKEVVTGDFTAGELDGLKVIYRDDSPSSIFVHIRLHCTTDGEITIRPAVPISFGKCTLTGLPCLAVHDFGLIPSPSLVREPSYPASPPVSETVEWIRHPVTPRLREIVGEVDGLWAVRSVHLDPDAEPIKNAVDFLKGHSEREPNLEFVLDDMVMPFFTPFLLPIPRHITIGIRRRVLDPGDKKEVFDFGKAPLIVYGRRSDSVERAPGSLSSALAVESLFYKSLPSKNLATDFGLSFALTVLMGADTSDPYAFELGLAEDYTIRVGYRRDFDSATGKPKPGDPGVQKLNKLLHFEIAGSVIVDIMALRLGYSLGRAIGERKGFLDSAEATADFFVSMPPSGGKNSWFKLRSLNGEEVAFAIEGVGWRQGSRQLGGIALPDGVIAALGPVQLLIEEFGLVNENSASYISFSGGLGYERPRSFEGSVRVKRLRFRQSGNPAAPPFLLDGIFLRYLCATSTMSTLIEVGGMYSERMVSGDRVRELGLTGTIDYKDLAQEQRMSVDILAGSVESGNTSYWFFMAQVYFHGSLILSSFELRSARLLFAKDMQPKLAAANPESRELRYYSWYKSSNPLNVPGNRRLAAWQVRRGGWALGIGAGGSFAALGKAAELSVFLLGVLGPDERGLLLVGELFLLGSDQTAGYLAVELDFANARFSAIIGVALTVEQFFKTAPTQIAQVGKLTGTLFVSNDPPTIAVGRLSDQNTWLSTSLDINLGVERHYFLFGICAEYVDLPDGPKGVGFVMRYEGGWDVGVAWVQWNAGFGFTLLTFRTGSTDFAASVWVEAGLRFVLFRIFRVGLNAGAELHVIGRRPSRGEMQAHITIETPWWLPHYTWVFERTWGTLVPSKLMTSSTPLRSAAAVEGPALKRLAVHSERFDRTWNGEGTADTFSIEDYRAGGVSENDRLTAFQNDAAVRPIATDSTITLEWTVSVNDKLGLDGNLAPGQGNQHAGDLSLSYDLVGITVRRRARFGPDKSWKTLEERTELGADFSDPNGVKLSGSFGPQQLTKLWDLDVQAGGRPASKKLLINATAPFDFQTRNPQADEEVARQTPGWPCCDPAQGDHVRYCRGAITFRTRLGGTDLAGPEPFDDGESRLIFLKPGYVRPEQYGAATSSGVLVAFIQARQPGIVFRAELAEDASVCYLRLAWGGSGYVLLLVGFDAVGKLAGQMTVPANTAPGFQNIVFPGQGPIRRLEARLVLSGTLGIQSFLPQALLEIDEVAYLGLRGTLDGMQRQETCKSGATDFVQAYEGRGKLFFLPNQEYEIAVTTRVSVGHPTTGSEAADVKEYVYFRTRGLPGLNAVQRIGEEIEPYVRSAYTGGKGVLYRNEPIALAFAEDFHIAVPLAPAGVAAERAQLLRMQLVTRPDVATKLGTPYTATSKDWIVENRTATIVETGLTWASSTSESRTLQPAVTSTNAERERLATLTQRSDAQAAGCTLADPRAVIGPVLVAPPHGEVDPTDPSRQLWPGGTHFTAAARLEGAGFVNRQRFEPVDATAFEFALDTGPGDASAWAVAGGELQAAAGGVRRFAIFGEPGWDHLVIQVGIGPGAALAGFGVALPAGGTPSSGLFAAVEQNAAGSRLVLYRRLSGAQFDQVKQVLLPAATDPAALIPLQVTIFDDLLRAAVGETVLEAERAELRQGRLCLIAQGAARFSSLQVRGLDLYTFPFATSRFRSFADHIASFPGAADVVGPDALGAGTTTSTASALWTATQAGTQAAMKPSASPEARQAIFDRWVRELGLPFRDEVTRLEISRFAIGNQTHLFLLESPEALDFSEEVTLTAVQQKPGNVQDPVDTRVIQDASGRRALLIPVFGTATQALSSGTYALTFSLQRKRWATNDPPDTINRYKGQATLTFNW